MEWLSEKKSMTDAEQKEAARCIEYWFETKKELETLKRKSKDGYAMSEAAPEKKFLWWLEDQVSNFAIPIFTEVTLRDDQMEQFENELQIGIGLSLSDPDLGTNIGVTGWWCPTCEDWYNPVKLTFGELNLRQFLNPKGMKYLMLRATVQWTPGVISLSNRGVKWERGPWKSDYCECDAQCGGEGETCNTEKGNYYCEAPGTPAPSLVTPSPITPAPVTPSPVTPAPATPAPVTPAPVTPAPATPSPVTPSPNTIQ